jgi:hypothetical protein
MENIKLPLAGRGFTIILAAKAFGNVSFKDYRQSI